MATKVEFKNMERKHFEKVSTFNEAKNAHFWNQCFDKGQLKSFVFWFLKNYGENQTVSLLEKLKDTGFKYATKAGVSISIDDLKIPNSKSRLISEAEKQIFEGGLQYEKGNITGVERFQKLIDTWHRTSEVLKQEVIHNFEMTDTLNPVYMMAFSGARGNVSQVRQLVGMRGLMADPQGQIIDFPIRSNFREGLTLTEYIISSYGARKGIVDTALRTANAGYLTRRLVDVAQHVIVAQFDCETQRGIFVMNLKEGNKTLYALQNRLIGRVLGKDLSWKEKIIAYRNQEVSVKLASQISLLFQRVFIRSPLTCETKKLVCQLCYGWSLAQGNLVSIGEAVGIIAAQSIGEPGTQLTMRTFHTGGVFSGDITDQIIAPFDGFIEYSKHIPGTLIRTSEGKLAFLTKSEGSFILHTTSKKPIFQQNQENGKLNSKKLLTVNNRKIYKIPSYTVLFVRNTEQFLEKQVLAQISIFSRQKKQRDDEERNMKSVMEGEVFHGHMSILEQINDYNELKFESWDWGYTWVLAGRIYQFPIRSHLFPKCGDLVGNHSPLNRIHWYISDTCSLEIKDFGNSRFGLASLKKSFKNQTSGSQHSVQNQSSIFKKTFSAVNSKRVSVVKKISFQSSVFSGGLSPHKKKIEDCWTASLTHSNLPTDLTLNPILNSYSSFHSNTNNPYLFSDSKECLSAPKNNGKLLDPTVLFYFPSWKIKRNNFVSVFNKAKNANGTNLKDDFKDGAINVNKHEKKNLLTQVKTQKIDNIVNLPFAVKSTYSPEQFGMNYHILLKKSLLNLEIQRIDYKKIGYFIFFKSNHVHLGFNQVVELLRLTHLRVRNFKKKKAFNRIQTMLENLHEKKDWKNFLTLSAKRFEDSFFIPFSLNFQSFSLLKNGEQSTSTWSPQSNLMMSCFPSNYQILDPGLFYFFLTNTTLSPKFLLKSYSASLNPNEFISVTKPPALGHLDPCSLNLAKRVLEVNSHKNLSKFGKNQHSSGVVFETKEKQLEWRHVNRFDSKAKQKVEYLGRIVYLSQPSFQIKTLVSEASVNAHSTQSLFLKTNRQGISQPFSFQLKNGKNFIQITEKRIELKSLKKREQTNFLVKTHLKKRYSFFLFVKIVKYLKRTQQRKNNPILLRNLSFHFSCSNLHPQKQLFSEANRKQIKDSFCLANSIETNSSNIVFQKDTSLKIYHGGKSRATFLSSILVVSKKNPKFGFASDTLPISNKHLTKILLKNKNVLNTIKFKELKIQIKKGWIYIPSMHFNFSSHKSLIQAGKTIVDDLIFDKNIIYVEALAMPGKNELAKVNLRVDKPTQFHNNSFKLMTFKNQGECFQSNKLVSQNNLSNFSQIYELSSLTKNLQTTFTEQVSRPYWVKSSKTRYELKIKTPKIIPFESNSLFDLAKLTHLSVNAHFLLIFRNVKQYYIPKIQAFKNKLFNNQIGFNSHSLLNVRNYQSFLLNKQKTDKFLSKFPNVDFQIQCILVNEANQLRKDLKTNTISALKGGISEILPYFPCAHSKTQTSVYFSKNAVNLFPLELKSYHSSHFSHPFKIPLFSLVNEANSNNMEQLDVIREREAKFSSSKRQMHLFSKAVNNSKSELTLLTNDRTNLWCYLLAKTEKSKHKHGQWITKKTTRYEFFSRSLNLLKSLPKLVSLPSLSFAIGQKINYLLNPRIYASYISRQNQGESFKAFPRFFEKKQTKIQEVTSPINEFTLQTNQKLIQTNNFLFSKTNSFTGFASASKTNNKIKNLLKIMSERKSTSKLSFGSELAPFVKPHLPFSPVYPLIKNQLFLNQKNQILSSSFFASTLFLSPFKGEILTSCQSNWLDTQPNKNISSTLKDQLILTATDLKSFSLGSQTFKEIYELEKQLNESKIRVDVGLVKTNKIELTKSGQSSDIKFIRFKEKVFGIKGLRLGYPSQNKRRGTTLCLGQFMFYADSLQKDTSINQSGLLIHINQFKITLRKGQSFFVSPKSLLHQSHGGFVHKNESVVTLTYQRVKTGDIVQGIPLLEQIFEARTTKKGRLFRDSLPNILDGIFLRSCLKLSRKKAVRQSFYKIRQIIVDGVQRVYRSQGVMVADKHIELIVKEMTSKVRIVNRGVTGFFPGELVDLDFVEFLNTKFIKKIKYVPCILGISKASLSADSFLSAASFQHTIKVLSRAAIYKKQDFLRGLKENVIVGSLPPTGTGYFTHIDDRIKFQAKYRKW